MKKQTYIISITIGCFGNLKTFYKTFAKGNREVILENIEFKGSPDQHNTGILKEELVCSIKEGQSEHKALQSKVENFLDKNNLHGEFFSIRKEGSKKVLFTEDDF
jgi:hypothetical protein